MRRAPAERRLPCCRRPSLRSGESEPRRALLRDLRRPGDLLTPQRSTWVFAPAPLVDADPVPSSAQGAGRLHTVYADRAPCGGHAARPSRAGAAAGVGRILPVTQSLLEGHTMAAPGRKRLIRWLAVLAALCLGASLVLAFFALASPDYRATPDEPTPSASVSASFEESASPGSEEPSSPDSWESALPSVPAAEEPSSAPPDGDATADGDTTSATDVALAGAAVASAFGGLCSGIAAIMVARRTPRQRP